MKTITYTLTAIVMLWVSAAFVEASKPLVPPPTPVYRTPLMWLTCDKAMQIERTRVCAARRRSSKT